MVRMRLWSWVYIWALLCMGVAGLVLALTVAMHPSEYAPWLALVIVFPQVAVALTQLKARDDWRTLGRLEEQGFVVDSMREAQQRGLAPSDWWAGYMEHVLLDHGEALQRKL